jgi:hypothetical protein
MWVCGPSSLSDTHTHTHTHTRNLHHKHNTTQASLLEDEEGEGEERRDEMSRVYTLVLDYMQQHRLTRYACKYVYVAGCWVGWSVYMYWGAPPSIHHHP